MYPGMQGDPISWGLASFVTQDWKSWKSKRTTSQKVEQFGLVGGLIGTAIYLYVAGRRSAPSMPPPAPLHTASASPPRGTYR